MNGTPMRAPAPYTWQPVSQAKMAERNVTLKLGRLNKAAGVNLFLGISGQLAELMGWKAGTVLAMDIRRLADGGRQLRFRADTNGRVLAGIGRGGKGMRATFDAGEDLGRFEAPSTPANWVTASDGEHLVVTLPWTLDEGAEGE